MATADIYRKLEAKINTQEICCIRKEPNNLLEYACKKRLEGKFNDAVIKVENEVFSVNKMVLSCFSEYFEKLFETEMREKYQNEVEIKGVTKNAMRLLIDFIYTGRININKGNVCDLLSASDMLQSDDVKIFCIEFLEKSITVETCIPISTLADLYRSETIQRKVQDFVAENIGDVVQCDDFKSLDKNSVTSFVNLKKLPALTAYKAFVDWTKYDVASRREVFPSLFGEINLHELTTEFLKDIVSEEDLVNNDPHCLKRLYKHLQQRSKQSKQADSKSTILSLGGRYTLNKVKEIFNISKKTEKIFPNMTIGREAPCAALLGQYVYIMGGSSESSVNASALNTVSCLNLKKDVLEWEDCAPMEEKRLAMGAAVMNETIYVVGGADENGLQLSSGEYFTPALNRSGSLPSMRQRRTGNALVACRGFLYSIGGFGNDQYLDTVERLHCSSDSWNDVASMHTCRRWLAGVVIDDTFIYAIGGQSDEDKTTRLKSVEMHDVATDVWTKMCDMNVERCAHSACVLQGKIYVSGGKDAEGHCVKSIECYDPTENKWMIIGETTEELINHALVTVY